MSNSALLPKDGCFEVGLNYWASHAATEMWSNWDEDVIRKDLKTISDYGFTIIRVFPRWDEFQPIQALTPAGLKWRQICEVRINERVLPDTPLGRCGISEVMMERFERFCDIAAENHLKMIVPILTGHMTSRLFVPPALFGRNLYKDPFALKYEVLFLQGFIERMKHHPAIYAWESGNESNFLCDAADEYEVWIWSYLIHATIRQADPDREIIGVSLHPESVSEPPVWTPETQRGTDMVSVHPYLMWYKNLRIDKLTGLRASHHSPLENKMLSETSGMTSFIEETGTWRPQIGSPKRIAQLVHNTLWIAWRENARALLWWCAFDQTDLPFAPYDWSCAGLEHGVFTADHQAYPDAEVFRKFAEFQSKLPFALPAMRSEKKQLCILTESEVGYAFGILARQSGLVFEYRYVAAPLEDADVYFLPSCAGRGGLSSRNWEKLKANIRKGATLYISLDNCFLDRLSEVCGCEVLDRCETNDLMTADFGGFTIEYRRDYAFRMCSCGAKILADDAQGSPVLFQNTYGRGTVYTLAFPLEARLLEQSGSFDGDARKLYERLFPVKRLFVPADGAVLCSEHPFDDGRVALLLTNNSDKQFRQVFPLVPEAQYTDSEGAEIKNGEIVLPPNSALLAVCRHAGRRP